MTVLIVVACNEGIDPISRVDPGPDETAPGITIGYPTEGAEIKVASELASINIQFEVTDDIEVQTVQVLVDGTEVETFTDFKDYRRYVGNVLYEGLATGDHTVTINATDLENKTTSKSVNFSKVPPYIPRFAGEIFYMPFDESSGFTELVSFTNSTVVGSPTLADEGAQGKSYAGAADSYLTFPATGLQNEEFSAFFWMKLNAVPDRAGILVMGPPDPNPAFQNLRTSGFRFFRENAGGKQRFKLNVGDGAADSWFDGGSAADVDPAVDEWVPFAFTISGTECVVYINGQVVSQGAFPGVSWAGCDILSIMSGDPRFTEWGHHSDLSYMDELRLFDKALTQDEIESIIGQTKPYEPAYDGEIFYMPFDGSNTDLASGTEATEVGSPGFETGISGDAYAGATDSYLTFPTDGLQNAAFSATFYLKVNAVPNRAGVLVMGPPDPNPETPGTQNLRTSGFRFFREDAGGKQRFKLNAGNGTAESWFDGGAAADVDPTLDEWVHFAFTISGSECVVYINGEVASQGAFTGVDWTGCDILSIMSGAPRFTGWDHKSDLSYMDELRIYNKALSQAEVQATMN